MIKGSEGWEYTQECIPCDCGALHMVKIASYPWCKLGDDPEYSYLTVDMKACGSHGFWRRLKGCWTFFRGKEHCIEEICLDEAAMDRLIFAIEEIKQLREKYKNKAKEKKVEAQNEPVIVNTILCGSCGQEAKEWVDVKHNDGCEVGRKK